MPNEFEDLCGTVCLISCPETKKFLAKPVSGSDWLRQADENCVQIDDFDKDMVIIVLVQIFHILPPSPKFTKCVSLDILWMIVESGKHKGFVW